MGEKKLSFQEALPYNINSHTCCVKLTKLTADTDLQAWANRTGETAVLEIYLVNQWEYNIKPILPNNLL